MIKKSEQKSNSFKIGFYGGVGDVTGANFSLQIKETNVLD
jgi:hypothetical protein